MQKSFQGWNWSARFGAVRVGAMIGASFLDQAGILGGGAKLLGRPGGTISRAPLLVASLGDPSTRKAVRLIRYLRYLRGIPASGQATSSGPRGKCTRMRANSKKQKPQNKNNTSSRNTSSTVRV